MSSTGKEPEFLEMDKLIVQNTMIVQHSENSNLLYSIFPKLEVSAGKLIKLVFQKVTIIDENDKPIILEHFLRNLPKAIAPLKTRATSKTKTWLFNWDKPRKIYCFSILLDGTLMEILKTLTLFKFLERLIVSVKKSTIFVQFEKRNENISNYLLDLIQAKQIYKQKNEGRSAPKVMTLKEYGNLI
uniref:Uncharacterized protein n=1 Tax=Panagrolaimus davidi TaxID=227884 RepID=A0A914QVJ2_9BILA